MGSWVPVTFLLCRIKNKDLFLCKLVFNIELPHFMNFNEQLYDVLHYQWFNEVLHLYGLFNSNISHLHLEEILLFSLMKSFLGFGYDGISSFMGTINWQ